MECLGGHCSSSSISSSSSLQSPLSSPGAGTEDGTYLSSIADGHCCGQRPLVSPAQMWLQREGTKPHVGFYNPLCLKNAMGGAGEIAVLNTEVLLPSREWLEMLPSLRLVFTGKIVKHLSSAPHHLPVCFTNSALQGLPPPSQESLTSPTGTQAITRPL